MYMYPSSSHKTAQIPWKSWENLAHYYLLTCCIVVNVIVCEIGRGKQAAGQSRAPGRVMWTKCLPRDTVQPMEAALRNSNEIICKHRKLRLQVPGKVFRENGRSILYFNECTCRQILMLVIFRQEKKDNITARHVEGVQCCNP